jgi:hypothetical protein
MARPSTPAVSGSLAKLSIEAFLDVEQTKQWKGGINPIIVGINPASYSQGLSAIFSDDKAAGEKNEKKIFNRPGETSLKMELILDGTGTVPGPAKRRSVSQQIVDLRRLAVQIDPTTKSPHYLRLVWGTLLFKGRVQSLDINCTLFNPDGTPLRAKVGATFTGANTNADGRPSATKQPAGSKIVTVAEGDTLPLLCDRLYGDSKYYIEIAKLNDLTSIRPLTAGAALAFPKLAELKEKMRL